ncbi:MAG: hypothetical protein KKD44_26555, partial [Proteobacteria bacterium]|nr:hypothetical protein [Pseudomonadota bacterium]
HFSAAGETPVINIIKDAPFSGTSLLFTDSGGTTLGSLTLQEFRGMGGLLLSPKAAEVKDNILFIGNTEEDRFEVTDTEFDTRVYRWNSTGTLFGYKDADGTEHTSSVYTLGVTEDVIQDRDYQETTYKYRKSPNSSRIGGDGPNISYVFKLIQLKGDAQAEHGSNRALYSNQYPKTWTAEGFETDNISFGNYASPYHSSQFRGYMRDEIYRTGIIFYDKRGRQSYVKWIADIKMPAVYESDGVTTYNADITGGLSPQTNFAISFKDTGTTDTYLNVLYPEFTVSIPAALAQRISGYEIVRVKREESDKGIACQGILGNSNTGTGSVLYPGGMYFYGTKQAVAFPTAANYDASLNKRVLAMVSPEINFRKSLRTDSGDYIKLLGTSGVYTNDVLDTGNARETVCKLKGMSIPITAGATYDVSDGTMVEVTNNSDGPTVSVDTFNYLNYVFPNLAIAFGGTKYIFTLPDGVSINTTGLSGGQVMYANYFKNLVAQYGGASYSNRNNNTFISTGAFISVDSDVLTTTSMAVFGGDIFVGFYDYLYVLADWAGDHIMQTVIYFPVETCINLPLRLDSCFHRLATAPSYGAAFLAETVLHMEQMWSTDDLYANRTDLYLENTAYSKDNDSKIYVPKPLNYDPVLSNPRRIHYSLQKGQNDIADRWLSFLPENYKDMDPAYGSVTNLAVLNDILLFTQKEAIGALGVNERALSTTETTASTLVLGTGGVLDDFKYISTQHGTFQKVIVGDSGLYFFDSINNKLMLCSGQSIPLSDIKGISSYLKDNTYSKLHTINRCFSGYGMSGIYDSVNNRIL